MSFGSSPVPKAWPTPNSPKRKRGGNKLTLFPERLHPEVLARVLAKIAQEIFHAPQRAIQGLIKLRIGKQTSSCSLARVQGRNQRVRVRQQMRYLPVARVVLQHTPLTFARVRIGKGG